MRLGVLLPSGVLLPPETSGIRTVLTSIVVLVATHRRCALFTLESALSNENELGDDAVEQPSVRAVPPPVLLNVRARTCASTLPKVVD